MMKKNFLTLGLTVMLCMFCFGMISASAATEGIYTYSVTDGKATITDCNTSAAGEITIPDTLGGYPVTAIGPSSIAYCNNITKITIPNGVRSIGNSAFYNCGGLKEVVVPNSVRSIGNSAFYGCDGLDEITIPNGVESIGNSAFYSCDGLTKITIPDSVTSIGNSVFYLCRNLAIVNLPDSITRIPDSAFRVTGLVRITIPNSVKKIGKSAFYSCDGLTNVTIPEGVEDIDGSFESCIGLKSITLPQSVESINGAFKGCTGLESITIPDSVRSINGAFEGCTGLKKITIPQNVTSMDSAFKGCTGLTNITMPNGVRSISGAFEGCTGLSNITIPQSITNIGVATFKGCTRLTDITILGKVTSIGDNAFEGCTGLADITIPGSVTTIGDWAFSDCKNLTRIIVRDDVVGTGTKGYIGKYAFSRCGKLTSVPIPDGVTSIGDGAFYLCTGLESITIPGSLASIGENVFYGCSNLNRVNITDLASWCNIEYTEFDASNPLEYAKNLYLNDSLITNLVIPDKVTKISGYAFSGSSITSVIIPDTVISVGDYAFENCKQLESATIGVTDVPYGAFIGCSGLKNVAFDTNVEYVRRYAFSNCSGIQTVLYEGNESQWAEVIVYAGNESLTNAKMTYNAKKKTYRFVTNCEETLPDITDFALFSSPVVKNEDVIFLGWYDNKELTGTCITFPYYGNATTLYAAWAAKTGLSFDDALTAKENEQYTVTIAQPGQQMYYKFVPKYTGEYRFYSKGSCNTCGYLYSKNQSLITSDGNSIEGGNFYISYNLTAGQMYYIASKLYGDGTGTYSLVIETDCVPGTETVIIPADSGEKIIVITPEYLPYDCQVILSCYKGGKFVKTLTLPNTNKEMYLVVDCDFDTAKVMVWNSLKSMKPLCVAEAVK